MSADDDLLVQEAVFVLREWTSPDGTRVRFRRRDAAANVGRRIIITTQPASIAAVPAAVGVITAATATDGHLTMTVRIHHGALTVGFARLMTEHPEGVGAAVVLIRSPRGRDVKELRTLYPLPAFPAEPQCSPDCPHHNHPDGAAAGIHRRHRRRRGVRPPITVQEADHG